MGTDHNSNPIVIIAAKAHDILISRLNQAGYEVLFITPADGQAWQSTLPYATGIVMASGLRIDEAFLNECLQLRWIARLGSGMELIDVSAAERRGVKVYSSPEGNANAVGEHTLGMLLSLMHKITSSSHEVANGQWIRDLNRGTELSGKTVGIIGFGNTGRAFARVLRGFDVNILAHDKYHFGFGNEQIKEVSLEQVLRYSHILSLHLPLSDETFHYANDQFFRAIGEPAIIINTSRGEVVDTRALVKALDDRVVIGAALDVLENENLSLYTADEKKLLQTLLDRKQVLITPHIAGYSHEAFYKMSLIIAEKLGL
jgi:D-3-phosphoglycerate dehydrogenase